MTPMTTPAAGHRPRLTPARRCLETRAVVLINAFEVPVEADDGFITGWERARTFLAGREAFTKTALHRAIRDDVDFRFVNVAEIESPDAFRDAVMDAEFPGRDLPFGSHASLYEVIHDDGDVDGADGVVLINPFEVPADADEPFTAGWQQAREFMSAQQGYLGTRLHRSAGPADFRFVNIARWSSPLMFARALQHADFRAQCRFHPTRRSTA